MTSEGEHSPTYRRAIRQETAVVCSVSGTEYVLDVFFIKTVYNTQIMAIIIPK